ncbi:MAG: hypothetical protein AAF960_16885 [Bacteroidota bacterium]
MRNPWNYTTTTFYSTVLLLLAFPLLLPAQTAQPIFVKQHTTYQNDIPKSLQRKFRRDAARLALRLEAEKEDLRYLNISIPQPTIEMVYGLLTNVYSHDDMAKSIAKCNVHTFPNPSIDQLVLIYEKDIDWAAPLRDGISETESALINDLLDEYELVIEKHVPWNDTQDALTIRSKAPLNMAALANEFTDIDGVAEIDLGVPKVSGNDIVLNRVQDGWELLYVMKFGSFSNGKGKKHIWKYHVLDSGSINFIEESGSPIPSWMRCEVEETLLVFRG